MKKILSTIAILTMAAQASANGYDITGTSSGFSGSYNDVTGELSITFDTFYVETFPGTFYEAAGLSHAGNVQTGINTTDPGSTPANAPIENIAMATTGYLTCGTGNTAETFTTGGGQCGNYGIIDQPVGTGFLLSFSFNAGTSTGSYSSTALGNGVWTESTHNFTTVQVTVSDPDFSLWSLTSVTLTDNTDPASTAATGSTTPLYCEYLFANDLCAAYGFDAAESATAFTVDNSDTDWLSPTVTPTASTIVTGNIKNVDFSDLTLLVLDIDQASLTLDGGTDTVDITTSYTFTCTDCPAP